MKSSYTWKSMIDLHKEEIIGLLVFLVALWTVLYFLPEMFVSLFNTLLGNFILLLSVMLVYSYQPLYGAITVLIVVLLYRFAQISKKTKKTKREEGFTPQSELDFLRIQHTINKQKVFDMRVLEHQASQEELDYFNTHGMWPWSEEVIALYEEAVRQNPYIRTLTKGAVVEARKVYNQAAIIRILTYQSKEGQFLLNGVEIDGHHRLPSGFGDFPYEAEIFDHPTGDIIRCGKTALERVNYSGNGLLNMQSRQVTPVEYTHLEELIPGFSFLQGPCNPCGALAAQPDYSCTYRLNKREPPSSIWQYLWA